jgi:serine protease AprX
MRFSHTIWFKPYIKKMDKPLKKELFKGFRHSKLLPSFTHNLINRISFRFKKYSVIVRLEDNPDQNTKDEVSRVFGSRWERKYKKLISVNSYYGRFTQKKLLKLLQNSNVKMIYLDRTCKALLDIASPTLGAPYSWDMGISGKGVTTAVIDTGIYPHSDLVQPVNRILAFKDFVKNKKQPYDDNGHGTHVAGDIASNGFSSNGLYKAPAFNSCLVGVKVLDKNGLGNYSKIISGIEWCIENKNLYGIRIICMSLGSDAAGSYKDDLICQAVEAAWKSGIVVCVAAGNEGPKYKSIASPGIDPVIITVGASDDRNTSDIKGDSVANFSSRGPTVDGLEKPDLVCPGTNIISLRPPRYFFDIIFGKSGLEIHYVSLSGTSMATPLCCSAVALLLEKNPALTPDQVKAAVIKACIDMGYDKNTQGNGCLNIMKLLKSDSITKQSAAGVEADQLFGLFSDTFDGVSPSQADATSDTFINVPIGTSEDNGVNNQDENNQQAIQPDNPTSDTYDLYDDSLEAAVFQPDNNTQAGSPGTPADVPASQQEPDVQDIQNIQDTQDTAQYPENQPSIEIDVNTNTPPKKNKCSPIIGIWVSGSD